MNAKLATAIEKWREASYEDNAAFQKELEPLYKSLVEATQNTLGRGPGQQLITNFLAEDKYVDRCVRWHLLKLAINNLKLAINNLKLAIRDARSGTETSTSNAHMRLAKAIMASENKGWNLLFYSPTGAKMKKLCKWERVKQEQPNQLRSSQNPLKQQTKQQAFNVTEALVQSPSRVSPHMRIKQDDRHERTLFPTALCEGNPWMKELLVEAQELHDSRQQDAKAVFANLVRNNSKDLHDDIVLYYKTAPSAFHEALCEIPGILQEPAKSLENDKSLEKDQNLLDRVITNPFLKPAIAILGSKEHRNLLTTRERVVNALDKWISEKNQQSRRAQSSCNHNIQNKHNTNDDTDDDENTDDDNDEQGELGGDNEEIRRRLAMRVLSNAPEDVLRSPEVLAMVMEHNLLNNVDILKAYCKDVKDDIKAFQMPLTPFMLVASFLKDVPGILHMAILYQQRPLVETTVRYNAQLAIIRAYVQTTTDGATIPERRETEASAETAAASVAKGTSRNQEVQNTDSGCYPLWFNNKAKRNIPALLPGDEDKDGVVERTRTWKEIRSVLIYCIMKHAENVQTLLNALRESGEPETEINFDMSRLLIKGTSVADFVKSMPRQGRSYSLIRYETIRYAEFPVLDLSTQPQIPAAHNQQHSHLQHTHEESLDMLNWLAEHGVRRIITLRVPDRMAHPHDELEIAGVVRRFRVEELDWRFLGLSLNIFKPHGEPEDIPLICPVDETNNNKPDEIAKTGGTGKIDKVRDGKTSEGKTMQETYLRRLHLYTGGRRSALNHWFSREGLESMKLDHVYIHVIKELTTEEQSNTILLHINAKIEELQKRKRSMTIEVQSQFWTAQTETPRLQEIIHHLSPRLAQFITYYRQKASKYHDDTKSFQPAKVAIIDNGILSMDPPSAPPRGAGSARPEYVPDVHGDSDKSNSSIERHLQSQEFLTPDNLWARICDGKSFVHEQDRVSPWYLASNPHGTQMANLICAIDPLCQLFVAKIADSHYGYSAERAAKAVEWAIDRGVDIISMSFTTTEDSDDFEKAVQNAMKAGILVICSHHDEGARIGTQVYASSFRGDKQNTMLRMASCNMYGKLLYDWDDNTIDDPNKKSNQYDFCINSQDVAVGAIPFLAASTERISGSSVATAIAAGLCSLLIACLRTLQKASLEKYADGNTERGLAILKMCDNVTRALNTNNRPTYASVTNYLAAMAPSATNPKFISLDRFARLDELRDVNTSSLSNAFIALGSQFAVK